MNYKETLEFLYAQLPAFHRIGKAAYRNDLGNSVALDDYFGHPHGKYPTIHVAGTNGKGSVSHIAASVLQEAGWKTGLYTSPHLKDFRERIRINGEMIPKRRVTEFVRKHQRIIDSLRPSFFELTVAMAFDHFAKEKAEVAVIETGLGGRLDSTNIINPIVSVITNIGHDHADLLGPSIDKIAAEKAGIIKRGIPAIIGEKQPDTYRIFMKKAGEVGAPICFADKNFACSLGEFDYVTGERSYRIKEKSTGKEYAGLTNLGGDYQAKNLVTLLQVIETIRKSFGITDDHVTEGIRNVVANTGLMGRWQVLKRNPLIVCDTGHNKEGLEYVTRQIAATPGAGLHIVLGFVDDKDLSSVLPLFPPDAKYYFTKASVPRALDEKRLMKEAVKYRLEGMSYPDVKRAFKAALFAASPEDMIFIGGSTFVVAEVV
ncbi:MAG: bifunctional folylpolyglutamate synthase/dihydrofolate synthase [Bacteroidales bacterium]|nr:bifunctional folylpolyglutamate synthase/dihydrofolate synthase [Bacteroidales bacterium]